MLSLSVVPLLSVSNQAPKLLRVVIRAGSYRLSNQSFAYRPIGDLMMT